MEAKSTAESAQVPSSAVRHFKLRLSNSNHSKYLFPHLLSKLQELRRDWTTRPGMKIQILASSQGPISVLVRFIILKFVQNQLQRSWFSRLDLDLKWFTCTERYSSKRLRFGFTVVDSTGNPTPAGFESTQFKFKIPVEWAGYGINSRSWMDI